MSQYEQISLFPQFPPTPLQREEDSAPHDDKDSMDRHRWMKALSHPIRWGLMEVLAQANGTLCVAELVQRFPRTQPVISLHLRRLHTAGLLGRVRRGTYTYYHVNPDALAQVRHCLLTLEQDARRISDHLSEH